MVVSLHVMSERRLQFSGAAMHATPELPFGQGGEPALYQVDPGAVGRREVDMKSWAFGEPVPDERGLVRAVVVHDQLHGQMSSPSKTGWARAGNLNKARIRAPWRST